MYSVQCTPLKSKLNMSCSKKILKHLALTKMRVTLFKASAFPNLWGKSQWSVFAKHLQCSQHMIVLAAPHKSCRSRWQDMCRDLDKLQCRHLPWRGLQSCSSHSLCSPPPPSPSPPSSPFPPLSTPSPCQVDGYWLSTPPSWWPAGCHFWNPGREIS